MSHKKILFVCLHNTGRSQMAEAFLNSYAKDFLVAESAGLEPKKLNPLVIDEMKKDGIDISDNTVDSVFEFFKNGKLYNYVITVCDEDNGEKCPVFPGVTHRIHWNYPDPTYLTEDTLINRGKVSTIKEGIKSEVKKLILLIKDNKLEDNVPKNWRIPSKWIEEYQ